MRESCVSPAGFPGHNFINDYCNTCTSISFSKKLADLSANQTSRVWLEMWFIFD